MDSVTRALLSEFEKSQQLNGCKESTLFEHFINYIILSDIYSDEFDVESISTGEGEFGIDGVCIIVNEHIVEDVEQLQDIADNSKTINARFVFSQAKTGVKFETGEISKFLIAVRDFFCDELSLKQNEKIIEAHKIKTALYAEAAKFSSGLPQLELFYATLGTWKGDENVNAVTEVHKRELDELSIFSDIVLTFVDAKKAQTLYFQTKNSFKAEFQFQNNISLPDVKNVREAYLGLIPAATYLDIIDDGYGGIRKKLFFDNIRDYRGDTPVNIAMRETIMSDRSIEFPLRNNGITIVCRKLHRVSNQFYIEDFQVVNGCQTSHVLFKSRDSVSSNDFMIPLKLISTDNEDVIREIIIGSNSQNDIDQNSFWALDPIHKNIEIYFSQKSGDEIMYYERRPGQYGGVAGIEKVRVVTKDNLLKYFASMFLEEPNRVGRYYKDLMPRVGNDIFNDDHDIDPYFTAAYSAYRLEWLFRNRRIPGKYKNFRYQMLMGIRLLIEKELDLNPNKKYTKLNCEKLDKVMADIELSSTYFEKVCKYIDEAVSYHSGDYSQRIAKMRDTRDKVRDLIKGVAPCLST